MSEAEEKLAKILHYQTSSPGFKWESEGNWYKNKCRGRAREIMEAGYLPVEPIQLEDVTKNDRWQDAYASKEEKEYEKGFNAGSLATIAHNEAKGQLYRRKE